MCIRDSYFPQVVYTDLESVNEFAYLGTVFTSDKNISEEIKRRTISANRCYFALLFIKSKRMKTP